MIKYFDIFAGIGGFRSGLEKAGGFECVGYCEIDKYARLAYETLYDTEREVMYDDARTIDPNELPDFDLICGGFPCQSFSIAGKRKGFSDTRGTLFFEIARIAAVKKPKYLLLENVPGLLSHDSGRTFAAILSTLDELGYDVACERCSVNKLTQQRKFWSRPIQKKSVYCRILSRKVLRKNIVFHRRKSKNSCPKNSRKGRKPSLLGRRTKHNADKPGRRLRRKDRTV